MRPETTTLIALDVGTSAVKAAMFDVNGVILERAVETYPLDTPKPGWVQQHPDRWWAAACRALKRLTQHPSARGVAGIGVAGQSWSAVFIDSDGRVLTDCPIWMDTRAADECAEIDGVIGKDRLFELCGNPTQPSYTLPKIMWLRNHNPDLFSRCSRVLQSNGFIAYRLTGALSQDESQGYGLQCFDMRKGCWDEDALRALDLPPSLLPPILPCDLVIGSVTLDASRATGLPSGVPVVAGGLDAACGTLGAGVVRPGQTQEQGGQAGGMSICLDKYAADPRLILSRHVVPGLWLLQGGSVGGGGALRWLQGTVCPELSFEDMSELAATVTPGSDGLVFLPYLAGERSPIWNPRAKGVFYGLDYGKTRAHMIRACMESVAFSLRHNLEVASAAGAAVGELSAMGGSANSRVWTQIKADVTGHEIAVPGADDATTLGAAILAGVGVGLFPSEAEAAERIVAVKRRHHPDSTPAYDSAYAQYRELYDRLSGLMI
ncbi:MAG: FGGY-family carbohydrate kinase [Oscillospiraceae bacterium]|jgi:xylulokinase|nr:FGGY-family carbohydrate kinase [Oscillospiraceae bacterium]